MIKRLKFFNFLTLTGLMVASLGLAVGLIARPAEAACAALPSSLGTVTLSINAPSTGSYRVWVREMAPSSNSSSFYLQLADAGICQVSMGGAAITAGSWTWIDYQNGNTTSFVNATLPAGNHQLILSGESSGVELDKVLILSDATCSPTGDGSNCTQAAAGNPTPTPTVNPGGGTSTPLPTPYPVVVPVGGSGTPPTVSGEITLASAGLPANTSDLQYFVDGKPVPSAQINTLSLADGTHTLEVKGVTPDGKVVTKKSTFVVKNSKSIWHNVGAFIQAHRVATTIAGVLIIAAPLGWLGAVHFGLISGAGAQVTTNLAGSTAPTEPLPPKDIP